MSFSLNDIRYCAEEVERQGDSARYVTGMARALSVARLCVSIDFTPDSILVRRLSACVTDSLQIWPAFRVVPVVVGDSLPIPWENIEHQIDSLLAEWSNADLDDDEWYRQFEEIHPFIDGNGRLGSILWNWRRGSLDEPVAPPNLWSKS